MISIWCGTDSLFLVKFPKQLPWYKIFYVLSLRLFARICDFFSDEHYACGDQVLNNLKKFGMKKPITLFQNKLKYGELIRSVHENFIILYYYPQKRDCEFVRWLYGKDKYEKIKNFLLSIFDDIAFYEVDGSQDLEDYYEYTDLLFRPNRHDGDPRMVAECELNRIPVVWTNTDVDNWILVLNILKYYYESKNESIPFDFLSKKFKEL
jgi:hypothetical protein